MENTAEDIVLDIRGQICPACLLITLSELNSNRERLTGAKARLVVKTDHRDATRTIPGAALAMGYGVTVVQKERHYEITLEHKE
ncbi:MAG: sulfurtransferase TusA family protein [Candidatus Sulfobium sp.]|jgi:TusA-related sulfurtransferase